MQRKPRLVDARLESLLDERDHLLIKISLAADETHFDPATLATMQKQLAAIEGEIARR
jgi:hypothetical protein